MRTIDMRSDTVTRPSPAMRQAMANAEVGDDVFGEDPTVNQLQKEVAALFGKEAGLFVPSGTMGNELCIKAHTQHGDEVILDANSHVFVYETAGPALIAGVQLHTVNGEKGILPLEAIAAAVRYKAYYMPPTRLICLENTHGRSGGSVLPIDYIRRVKAFAAERKLRLHLDGARIWNAHVASGVPFRAYGDAVDSLSVCFSKGLGAPVGSMLLGSTEFVEIARRYRKIFGGGMRQAGILAAAASFAIRNNIERLAEDHEKAKYFAAELSSLKGWKTAYGTVETNMAIMDGSGTGKTQDELLNLLKDKGVLLTPEGDRYLRCVTHIDVSSEDVKEAVHRIKSLF